MTSKEALEQLKMETIIYDDKTHISHYGRLDIIRKPLVELIEKDLEELKEYKKIMGTPIQEIMKNLKTLEKQDKILGILKENAMIFDNQIISFTFGGEITKGKMIEIHIAENEDEFKEIKEWLDNDNLWNS